MNDLINIKSFEDIKHIDEYGNEFWYARELQLVLQYSKWENFEKVINKAIKACENSNINILEHFPDVRKTIKMPKSAEKTVVDYKLSRYACYLIAQNGDSRKRLLLLLKHILLFKLENKKYMKKNIVL